MEDFGTFYKVLTHDLRPPIQRGDPLFKEGDLPFTLPAVPVDTSEEECGEGWNACRTPEEAFLIAGLWRDGRPARLFKVVVPEGIEVIERGSKVRFTSGVITEEITDLKEILDQMYEPFGDLKDPLTQEVLKWREALSRPCHDPEAVKAGLREALNVRGLSDWNLQEFKSIDDLRDAWDAWDARAWDARAAWAARDACAARAALTVFVAASKGWTKNKDPMLLATGIRDAYRNGLEMAFPVGGEQGTLGYCIGGSAGCERCSS